MKPFVKFCFISITATLGLLLLLVAILWFKPPGQFPHDTPRDLPWQLPDYTQAKTQYKILDDGRIQIDIEHLPLVGVSPEMVSYFYKVLPISTVNLNGVEYPLYHLFHPSEHGKIEVKQPATDGSLGMGVGALVARQEWFGPYNSKGAGRVMEFSKDGMRVKPEMLGLHFGEINHHFEKSDNGTRYHLNSIIGSDLPILGPVINYYIRHKMFNEKMLSQWLRHQVQEVSSLPFFLPQLYAQKDFSSHHQYTLKISPTMAEVR